MYELCDRVFEDVANKERQVLLKEGCTPRMLEEWQHDFVTLVID